MLLRGFMFKTAICLVSTLCLAPFVGAHVHSEIEPRPPVCLKEFPTDPSQFNDLVRPYVKKIIGRHGLEEWKATLLTNELHRHLGLWSIIGAKMGIRAREILGAPADAIDVVSFAGVVLTMGSRFPRGRALLGELFQLLTWVNLWRSSYTTKGRSH